MDIKPQNGVLLASSLQPGNLCLKPDLRLRRLWGLLLLFLYRLGFRGRLGSFLLHYWGRLGCSSRFGFRSVRYLRCLRLVFSRRRSSLRARSLELIRRRCRMLSREAARWLISKGGRIGSNGVEVSSVARRRRSWGVTPRRSASWIVVVVHCLAVIHRDGRWKVDLCRQMAER